MSNRTPILKREFNLPDLNKIHRYHIRQALILSLIPLLCGVVLALLMYVFAKLNLYYLEANGLLLDRQVRNAYYSQVALEITGVTGYLLLQLLATTFVSFVVVRWATAPFRSAMHLVKTALCHPENLRPVSRWLTESPVFDQVVWLFCLRIKSGGDNRLPGKIPHFRVNLHFYLKFLVAGVVLSVVTGYTMGIIFGSVYRRIVDLALHLVQETSSMPHYLSAQEEVLTDATTLLTGFSLVLFAVVGLFIARYMATMIYVFARSIQEDSFPITLRSSDVYGELAQLLNEAREKIRQK